MVQRWREELMKMLIALMAVAQMFGGIVVFLDSKSAIHEILGATAFGFGACCLALASIIDVLQRQHRLMPGQQAAHPKEQRP